MAAAAQARSVARLRRAKHAAPQRVAARGVADSRCAASLCLPCHLQLASNRASSACNGSWPFCSAVRRVRQREVAGRGRGGQIVASPHHAAGAASIARQQRGRQRPRRVNNGLRRRTSSLAVPSPRALKPVDEHVGHVVVAEARLLGVQAVGRNVGDRKVREARDHVVKDGVAQREARQAVRTAKAGEYVLDALPGAQQDRPLAAPKAVHAAAAPLASRHHHHRRRRPGRAREQLAHDALGRGGLARVPTLRAELEQEEVRVEQRLVREQARLDRLRRPRIDRAVDHTVLAVRPRRVDRVQQLQNKATHRPVAVVQQAFHLVVNHAVPASEALLHLQTVELRAAQVRLILCLAAAGHCNRRAEHADPNGCARFQL